MSLPTPQPTNSGLTPVTQARGSPSSVLDSISIQDLESGKLNIDSLLEEVHGLRTKIAELRYEMALYIKLLATINDNTVSALVYQDIFNQVQLLKGSIDTYFNTYKRLLPVIRYAKLKIGMNPDDSMKIPVHSVPVDTKLLHESMAIKSEQRNGFTPNLAGSPAFSNPSLASSVMTTNIPPSVAAQSTAGMGMSIGMGMGNAKKGNVKAPKRRNTGKRASTST